MRRIIGMKPPLPRDVTFNQINRILEVTDEFELDREWIEIPLSAASHGKIDKLPNGKIEIVVDAVLQFVEWTAEARGMYWVVRLQQSRRTVTLGRGHILY